MADMAETSVRPGLLARSAARSGKLTLPALAIAGMVVSVMQTVVLPLLPRLATAFHASVASVTWVLTTTLLAGAVATPVLSRLGDMYGKKKMIVLAMVLLVAGSLVCVAAGSLGVLIAGRTLQGVSAAVIPLAIGTIRDVVPRERVMTAIGIVSATLAAGSAAGLLLTGIIAAHTDNYHPVFWISAGVGVLGLLLVTAWVPAAGQRAGGWPDLPGALTLAAWLVCLLLALTEGGTWGWRSGRIIGLFAAAAVVCALWAWIEARAREPLVRLNLLSGPRSLSANLASLLLGFAMFAGFTLVSSFVQTPRRFGYGLSGSVLDVGLYLMPGTVATLVFSRLAGRFEARIGAAWTLATGSAITGASYLWLAIANAHVYDMLIFSVLQGVGFGVAYAALGTVAVQHVPMDQSAIASGINSLVRMTGGSLGAAITASVLTSYLIARTTVPAAHGYVLSFVISAAAAGLAAAVAAAHAVRYRG
jgi:predicted MFS family arabinose efflux permease